MEYEGGFRENLLHGYGNLYNEMGSLVYRGYFDDGVKSGTGVEYYHTGSKLYEGQFGNDKFNGYGKWWTIMGELQYDGWFIDGEPAAQARDMVVPLKKPKKRKIVYQTPQIFLPPAPVYHPHNCSNCEALLCDTCHKDMSPKKKPKKKKKKPEVKVEDPPAPVPVVETEQSPKPCERCIVNDEADVQRAAEAEAEKLRLDEENRLAAEASEAERLRKEEDDRLAAETERLRQEEEDRLTAEAEAERLRVEEEENLKKEQEEKDRKEKEEAEEKERELAKFNQSVGDRLDNDGRGHDVSGFGPDKEKEGPKQNKTKKLDMKKFGTFK